MILRHYAFFIFRMADKAGCDQTKDAVINQGVPMFVECIESASDKYPGGPDLISPFKWEDVKADWDELSDDEKDLEYEDIAMLIDGCWRDLEFAYYTNHDRNAFKFILGDYYRIHQITENFATYPEDSTVAQASPMMAKAKTATATASVASVKVKTLSADGTETEVDVPDPDAAGVTSIPTRKSRVDYYSLNLS